MNRTIRRLIGLFLVISLIGGAWLWWSGHVPADDFARLSATLDAEIAEWAAKDRPRSLLFGKPVPGVAMEFYAKAIGMVEGRRRKTGVIYHGQRPDQHGLAAAFELIRKGACAEGGIRPGQHWDGRPFDCRNRVLEILKMHIQSEAVWGWKARLKARRAHPPSDGPTLLSVIENTLALMRMNDDLCLAAGGACRECMSNDIYAIVCDGFRILEPELMTLEEKEALRNGLGAYLLAMPGPEDYAEEVVLHTQTGFRAAIAGDWPIESYRWKTDGCRKRSIYKGWLAYREYLENPETLPEEPIARRALNDHSPADLMDYQRHYRRQLAQYLLGVQGSIYREANGAWPEKVANIRPPEIRAGRDGGRWACGTENAGKTWSVWWIKPDGEESWKLQLRPVLP